MPRFLEYDYYSFGLELGLRNLFRNGFGLGLRKTVGKITQPINSYTRFPEYFYIGRSIEGYLDGLRRTIPRKILDVGSPKCFGLYLASRLEAEVHLTDISPLNVDEYRLMWNSVRAGARGRALFSIQDARCLGFKDAEFDVVYAMSVVEHIEGDGGDTQSIREMIRLLKPGGLFLLSIPFGPQYLEQYRVGFSGAARKTGDCGKYFFQRIYSREALAERILAKAPVQVVSIFSVWRRNNVIRRFYGRLGENVRGAIGFANPLLSSLLNQACEGFYDSFETSYTFISSLGDNYGDLVIVGQKTI